MLTSQVFARLTEIDKIHVRGANSLDRLRYLGDVRFRYFLADDTSDSRLALMEELKALCELEYADRQHETGFPKGWAF
jgi:hypothetical protein